MPKSLTDLFEETISLYLQTLETYCLDSIKNAKDKPYVLGKMINQVNDIIRAHSRGFSPYANSHLYFLDHYRSGTPVDEILSVIETKFPESLAMKPVTEPPDETTHIPFSEPEEKLLGLFPGHFQKIVRMHASHFALQEVINKLPGYLSENSDLKERSFTTYPIQWTGSKDNKNEFVQLIYGLYKAKLLNGGQGEITKIVENLAQAFKVELSPNWQANLSASIHKSNTSYKPQVFDKINQAYQEYAKALIEHKKQNR